MSYYKIGNDFKLKEVEKIIDGEKKVKKSKPVPLFLLNVGFYIITPLLLAIPIGLYLDNLFKTKNIFILVLIFLGFLSTMYNLIRLTKRS